MPARWKRPSLRLMTVHGLKPTEEFAGQLVLAMIGGLGLLVLVLAMMVVAYLSEPEHDHLGRPMGGSAAAAEPL